MINVAVLRKAETPAWHLCNSRYLPCISSVYVSYSITITHHASLQSCTPKFIVMQQILVRILQIWFSK